MRSSGTIQSKAQHILLPKMTAFGYLLGLYGENYERLLRLLGDVRQLSGKHQSQVQGHPTLYVDVLEQHRHTTILRITHLFDGPDGPKPEPSAWVRVYHDAQQAEVTHCWSGTALKQLFSMSVPAFKVTLRRHRMNVFFNKWLEHLLGLGHTHSGLQPMESQRKQDV
jgi:uncharacterized protein